MRLLTKGLRAVNMVFTANQSIVASTPFNSINRRSGHNLASKLTVFEQRTYEVSFINSSIYLLDDSTSALIISRTKNISFTFSS